MRRRERVGVRAAADERAAVGGHDRAEVRRLGRQVGDRAPVAALVLQEVQNGVVGEPSALPALPAYAELAMDPGAVLLGLLGKLTDSLVGLFERWVNKRWS